MWDAPQRGFTGMVQYQGESIDLGSPFRRASMADLVKEVRASLSYHHPMHPLC